jgi:hypothetical protein
VAYEEKRAWIMLVVSAFAYVVYPVIILGRSSQTPLMALAEWDHFWIANVIYLTFVLSAVVGSVAKIFAYRQGGFQSW